MLGCHSCHDPHGNTNFMMVYGVGETAADYPGGYLFTNPAPIAIGLDARTGIGQEGAERNERHVAYISGMSGWCANCHEEMNAGMSSAHVHPVDVEIGGRVAENYNAYVTTGDMTGNRATAYLPLVPFEDSEAAPSSSAGANPTSRVFCLTCHRAHASPYQYAGRWDFNQTFIKDSVPSNEPYLSQYVNQPLDLSVQRSLCNKCHSFDRRQ
jgi:hypothetical protein